jgi:hypothetical protein
MLTFEEWWAYDRDLRRRKPYSAPTELHHEWLCRTHGKRRCQCPIWNLYEKATLSRDFSAVRDGSKTVAS